MGDDIPAFARKPTNNNNKYENDNSYSSKNNDNTSRNSNENGSPNLPMYAVVLIIVFLLALFVAVVCTYFYCKRKLKKRKMKKNRMMLQMSGQQYNGQYQNSTLWGNGWNNGGYGDNETIKNSYYDSRHQSWAQNTKSMNDKMIPTNNDTLLQHQTDTIKRKAPPPPKVESDDLYENLRVNEGKWKSTSQNVSNQLDSQSFVSEATTLNNVPAIMKETQQQLVNPSWPANQPVKNSIKSSPDNATNATSFASQSDDEIHDAEEQISSGDESIEGEASLHSNEETLNDNDEIDDQANDKLMGILTQWKEHLFSQKNELQDYYNRLTGYVESVAIQPIDSVSNVGVNQSHQRLPTSHQSKQKHEKRRRLLSYPRPPESVIDDVKCSPDDIEGQQKIISNLRTRLSELEELLRNPKELEEDPKETNMEIKKNPNISQRHSQQKQHTRPRKSFNHSQSLPSHSFPKHNVGERKKSSTKHKMHSLKKNERVTIQKLLAQLDRNNGEQLMQKIIKFQQVSKKQVKLMSLRGRKEHLASFRLARQIHHVMRDVVNPRLQTNMMLATAAACNLSSKMSKSFHTSERKDFENFHEIAKLCDRITGLVRHMNDMSKQLVLRIESYYKDDFYRFIDAFMVMALKVLNATQSFVTDSTLKEVEKKEKPKEKKKSIRLSQADSGLNQNDVVQLSDGLTKLENLLKSGKLSSFDKPPAKEKLNEKQQNLTSMFSGEESCDSCDSDCDKYSYTSCSTCYPSPTSPEKNQRNPYLFPGTATSKSLPYQSDKIEAKTLPINYGNIRPPTRPNNSRKESNTSFSKCQKLDKNLYSIEKNEDKFFQPDSNPTIDDRNHEVLLAKYLNELLKTQNDKPSFAPPYDQQQNFRKNNDQKQSQPQYDSEKNFKTTNKKDANASKEEPAKKKQKDVKNKKEKKSRSPKNNANKEHAEKENDKTSDVLEIENDNTSHVSALPSQINENENPSRNTDEEKDSERNLNEEDQLNFENSDSSPRQDENTNPSPMEPPNSDLNSSEKENDLETTEPLLNTDQMPDESTPLDEEDEEPPFELTPIESSPLDNNEKDEVDSEKSDDQMENRNNVNSPSFDSVPEKNSETECDSDEENNFSPSIPDEPNIEENTAHPDIPNVLNEPNESKDLIDSKLQDSHLSEPEIPAVPDVSNELENTAAQTPLNKPDFVDEADHNQPDSKDKTNKDDEDKEEINDPDKC